jgi:hypothetical protein
MTGSRASPQLRPGLLHGGRRGFAITALVGIVSVIVALLAPHGSELQGRIAFAGMGALCCVLPLARPEGFWELGSVRDWREALGDRAFVAVYLAFGIIVIVVALIAPIHHRAT